MSLVDALTGKDAVIAFQAALTERSRSAHRQHVEVNLLSTLLAALANQASAYFATGIAPRRMGNQHPSIALDETLNCKDGLIAVACGTTRSSVAWPGRSVLSVECACGVDQSRGVDMEALLMKVPEVAAQLGMSRAKVYELMASGTLRSVRVDGCRRVRTDDLIAFVANLDERWPEHVCTRGRSAVPSRR